MFKQARPGVPVTAIMKVWVPCVSGGTAQRIRYRTIGLMLFDTAHAKDVPVLGEHFKVINPQSLQKLPKNQVLEKSEPLTENFQNLATKGFMRTPICAFQPKKGWYFAPFSLPSEATSPKILQDHSFPILHPYAKFCPNQSSFQGDISKNVFQTHYNISA